ncbi:hypothetical protein ON010_g12229 [Phytophthora cinnamomi]|nr:hypothetical protein ON010_g12229 [Phytophthora cinnamomi]
MNSAAASPLATDPIIASTAPLEEIAAPLRQTQSGAGELVCDNGLAVTAARESAPAGAFSAGTDREDEKTLVDARVSSAHITNVLNERTANDRLKDKLHGLRQLDGSDVPVMQDQMDVTSGVAMQTKVQKQMFEKWGETLAMDFTHGTNNLGYQLVCGVDTQHTKHEGRDGDDEQAAVTTAKRDQTKPDEMNDRVKSEGIVLDLVATIDPKLWQFSGSWIDDRKWLEQNWRKVPSVVGLFAQETSTCGKMPNAIQDRHRELANEIIGKFTSSRLRSEFVTQSGNGLIMFDNIVGGIGTGWLNDSCIDFCLEAMATPERNCYVLSLLTGAVGWPKTPKESLGNFKFIVHTDSMPNVKMVVDPIEWVESPEQPDATSCGAMIVALAYNFITGKMDIQTYSISNNDVKVMRLRMLWVIMHCSQERTLSNVDAAKVDKIH